MGYHRLELEQYMLDRNHLKMNGKSSIESVYDDSTRNFSSF